MWRYLILLKQLLLSKNHPELESYLIHIRIHKSLIKFDLLSDEEIKVLKKYKVWGKKKFMGREFMGIIRSTFLIDKKGKIIKIWENVKVKDHAKEVLETLREFSKK